MSASRSRWIAPLTVLFALAAYFLELHHPLQNLYQTFADTAPIVVLPQGRIVGTHLTKDFPQKIEAFLGFPYAIPPTGDRRFRTLQPLPLSNEKTYATKYGPLCPGKPYKHRGPWPDYSEDCLTINVYRPLGVRKGAQLPVALHVHGGAFNRGWGKH